MKSRAVNTTKEQDEYRESILKKCGLGKRRNILKKQNKMVWSTDNMNEEEKNGYYIVNCVYWINEYMKGATDLQKAKSAAKNLIIYLNEPHKLNPPTK